jgi:hypothetical protein
MVTIDGLIIGGIENREYLKNNIDAIIDLDIELNERGCRNIELKITKYGLIGEFITHNNILYTLFQDEFQAPKRFSLFKSTILENCESKKDLLNKIFNK